MITMIRLLALILVGVIPLGGQADDGNLDELFSRYARYGADVWAENPSARISGEGEACISCHTSLPYALVEPLLPGSYPAYEAIIYNVNNRVRTWFDNTPWYSDEKLTETAALSGMPSEILIDLLDAEDSRGVEAIFNAFIMATRDAYAGLPARPETRQALQNMWSAQIPTGPFAGRWHWLQVNLIPWEAADSDIWGASLACVAASVFPDLAPEQNLSLLYTALRNSATGEDVSLHTKASILWCDAESGHRVLHRTVAERIVADLFATQHSNGGWALREIGPWVEWEGSDSDCCAKRDVRPDAYATGFVALALERNPERLSDEQAANLSKTMEWIAVRLADPYPAEPRHNTHNSSDVELPSFRNNLYTNAGHMWAYIARKAHSSRRALWESDDLSIATADDANNVDKSQLVHR